MLKFLFAIFCYLLGLSSLCAFFWRIELSWDSNPLPFSWAAVVQNLIVFLIFPVQHSILAREEVKRKVRKIFTPLLERPVYVGSSGLAMWFVLFYWVPFGPYLYRFETSLPFDVIFYLSLVLIIYSTTAMNHATMFGLKQGYAAWKNQELPESPLQSNGIYGVIRHPLTTLLILALWSHETLTAGRLEFNMLFTAYALIGTVFEERDLIKKLGKEYIEYSKRVPAYLPRLGRS